MKKGMSISKLNAAIILGSMLAAIFIVFYKPAVKKPREEIGNEPGVNAAQRAKIEKKNKILIEIANGAVAKSEMVSVVRAEKMYAMEQDGRFLPCKNDELEAKLGVAFAGKGGMRKWEYDVKVEDATGMKITATRTSGPYQGKTLIMDQSGNLGGTFAPEKDLKD